MPKVTSQARSNKPPQSTTRPRPKKGSSSSDEMPKAAKTKTKARGEKKKKDPNAPKRGLSAYMFYANANRERVRAENVDITFGQVGKVLGEEWKSLDAQEKEKYDEMARKDKIRYETEKAKYNAGDDDEDGSD